MIRRRIAHLIVLFALVTACTPWWVKSAPPQSVGAAVERVAAVGFTVSNMEQSVRFFSQVLTFETESDITNAVFEIVRKRGVDAARMRVVRMRLGGEYLVLTQYLGGAAPRGYPADARSNDRWFQHIAIVVRDMDLAYAHLGDAGVESVSPAPQTLPAWNPNAGGIRAFYFKDPDGHPLEILQFPDDKGSRRWHHPTDRLFLGIDHTAIVVGDTEASLHYYRDLLGLRVVGGSDNYGPEQARLNNVEGAHLRITTLRGNDGPGVEFLEYLMPPGGRPFPSDSRETDLYHWQTTLVVRNVAAAARRLSQAGPSPTPGETEKTAAAGGILSRDPDGHAILLVAP